MKALILVLAMAGSAYAETDLIVTSPPKWRLDREKSAAMNLAAQGARHFGTAPSLDVTEAYFPNEIGAALIVTRSTSTALPDGRDPAIAAAIDELETWTTRGGPITDVSKSRKALDDAKLLEIVVGGRDAAASTRSMFRMIVAADATRVVTVTGLCLDRDDSNPDHIALCRAALTTLDPGIPVEARVALGFPTAAPPAPVAPAEPTPAVKSTAPSMGDGTRLKLAPITVPGETPTSDRRPVYIGLGIVVLAAIFWWNRKKRDAAAAAEDPPTDDDDLHAAANQDDKGDKS